MAKEGAPQGAFLTYIYIYIYIHIYIYIYIVSCHSSRGEKLMWRGPHDSPTAGARYGQLAKQELGIPIHVQSSGGATGLTPLV